jgi:hypothetical protein
VQRQLAPIEAVEIEQIEGDEHDLARRPRGSFCNTEKSVMPSATGTTTSPSMIAVTAGIGNASSRNLPETFCPVVAASGVDLHVPFDEMDLDAVALKFDLESTCRRPARARSAMQAQVEWSPGRELSRQCLDQYAGARKSGS